MGGNTGKELIITPTAGNTITVATSHGRYGVTRDLQLMFGLSFLPPKHRPLCGYAAVF